MSRLAFGPRSGHAATEQRNPGKLDRLSAPRNDAKGKECKLHRLRGAGWHSRGRRFDPAWLHPPNESESLSL
ncbi:MAG: hypothetical protein FD161_4813 [Limisphaerales bacterium]|nr:MAG: hypothetical protein FD161_4813 [Limisphaerales bacterium]